MVSTTKPQDSVMKKDQSEGGVQELQTHGRELYRQKQFGAALECFTEILVCLSSYSSYIPLTLVHRLLTLKMRSGFLSSTTGLQPMQHWAIFKQPYPMDVG